MKNKFKQAFSTILGLAIIVGLGWLVVLGFIEISKWYGTLSESIQTGIIAAVPILVVAVLGYFANKSLETRRSIEQAMRPKKLELYDSFVKYIMTVFANENFNRRPTEKEMIKFFTAKTPELMTFASNDVIEKWGKFRTRLSDESIPNEQKMFTVEELFIAIRKDLGHNKRGFHKGDVLRLFVNDVDNYIKK
jgi:hypothetical protein